MRIYTLLFLFSIVLAFISGQVFYSIRKVGVATEEEVKEISQIKKDLEYNLKSKYQIDLNLEYPEDKYLTLLRPKMSYANILGLKISPFSIPCNLEESRKLMTSLKQVKSYIWESYRCGYLHSLPKLFFESPPFIHKSGYSFAFLAFQSGPSRFRSLGWIMSNIGYFHLSELKLLKIRLPDAQKFLTEMNKTSLDLLLDNTSLFSTKNYLIQNIGPLVYNIYPLEKTRDYISQRGFQLNPVKKYKECFYKEGNLCWKKRPNSLIEVLSQTLMLQFIAALSVLLLTGIILYRKFKKQKIEEERRKHSLRLLTHELRTPISALLLNLEKISQNSENLDSETVEKFLRIESDVYRLKHLAEKSRGYLQANSEKLIQLNPITIDSVKEFMKEIINESKITHDTSEIQLMCKNDFKVLIDPYWLKLCVVNLIDNAIKYGTKPVLVDVTQKSSNFSIRIIDQGDNCFASLDKILKSEVNSNQGLGMGLKIVNTTVREMGGRLSFSSKPTTFSIHFPKDEIYQ